jgi:twitching motility protein PilT
MVDALPAEEREQTKGFLSQSLIGVVTQVLVRTPDLRARRAVCEVMVMNRAIGKLIMTDQTHMLPSQLQTGREAGMQTMDQALLAAIQAREVDPEDAFVYATDKRPFTRYVPDGTAILKADVTQGVAG